MNERIFTELYKKTWGHFPCPTGEPELEKFAELIVRECLNIAHLEHKKALEFDWDNDDTAQTIRDSISKHFGVEE